MGNEPPDQSNQASHLSGDDEQDRIVTALDLLETSAARDGNPSWKTAPAWQEACLEKWASSLGLLLDAADFIPRVERGGQEHDARRPFVDLISRR